MKIQVRYFASLREALGPIETVELSASATVATLREALIGRGGRSAGARTRSALLARPADGR